jgi:hypothetical protein
MQLTFSSNTTSSWITTSSSQVFFQAAGTFGGGTLTIETQLSDGSSVQSIQDASWTSGPISKVVVCPPGLPIRAKLAGATSPSVVVDITPF